MSAFRKDTEGGRHRVLVQWKWKVPKANKYDEEVTRRPRQRRWKGSESEVRRAFPSQEVRRGDPEERTSHMNVPLGWAVLDCGVAKSLAGAEPAAMLAQACEKRGRKAGDDRKVEVVEEKHHVRGIGEQAITSFIKLEVPGQDMHYAPSNTDGSTPPLVGNDHLLPCGSSIHLYPGDCWLEIPPTRTKAK